MLWRVVKTYLQPQLRIILALVCLQTVQALALLMLPTLVGRIIDWGVAVDDTPVIYSTGALMVLVSIVHLVVAGGASFLSSRLAMGVGRDIRRDVFNHVMDFSAEEIGKFGAPSLITRITNDVQQVQMVVLMGLMLMVPAPVMLVGGLLMAIREDVALSGILAVALPALLLCVGVIMYKITPLFQLMQDRLDSLNQVLREQLIGLRVVRAFVREEHESQRFDAENEALTDVSVQSGKLMALLFPLVMLVLNLSVVAVVWFGASRVESGAIGVGGLVAFISYLIQILIATMMATLVALMAPRSIVSAERICEVIDTDSSFDELPAQLRTAEQLSPARGEIVISDVGFQFPGAESPVISGISVHIKPGETLAVIGSTGSGKTTLINLLARLVLPSQGNMIIDDVPVQEYPAELLWARIGLVPQRAYLFTGTVRSNIAFGKSDATDAEIWQSLEIAQAADFVRAMSDGLDTRIEQGGTNVSGGQRQRLAIARALVRNPKILLFDDSFSALDMSTEARLRAALSAHASDATTVLVGQRISSIQHADQILVLEAGRSVGLGTHDELLETCSTYQEIVESQMGQVAP